MGPAPLLASLSLILLGQSKGARMSKEVSNQACKNHSLPSSYLKDAPSYLESQAPVADSDSCGVCTATGSGSGGGWPPAPRFSLLPFVSPPPSPRNSIPHREGSPAHTCGRRSPQLKPPLPTHTPGPPLGAQRVMSQSSMGRGKTQELKC